MVVRVTDCAGSKVEALDGNGRDSGISAGDTPRLQTDGISRHSKSRIDAMYVLWSARLAGCLHGAWDRKDCCGWVQVI